MSGVMHIRSQCDDIIQELIALQISYGIPSDDFKREGLVIDKLLKMRHGLEPIINEPYSKGSVYIRNATSLQNEHKFSSMWSAIIYVNNKSVDQEVITKYDALINDLITSDDSDQLWHDLHSEWFDVGYEKDSNESANAENVRTQIIPKFRCADKTYYAARLLEQIRMSDSKRLEEATFGKRDNAPDTVREVNKEEKKGRADEDEKEEGRQKQKRKQEPKIGKQNKERKMFSSIFQDIHTKDKDIFLPYDLSANGKRPRRLSAYLTDRMNMELNPNYPTHPIMLLLITIIFLKSRKSDFFSYGIRYLELYMNNLPVDGVDYHMPFEFRSNGEFVSIHYHSHVTFRFKFILNSLSNLYMHESVHLFRKEYIELNDELTLYMLNDVNARGKELKKIFSIFNLYYGMNCKKPGNDTEFKEGDMLHAIHEDEHIHPSYPTQKFTHSWMLNDVAYVPVIDCSGCIVTNADRGVFTKEVRNELKMSIDTMSKKGLLMLKRHCINKLLYRRANPGIISDVIFVRMIINSGGYAHTHKILDFDQIDKNFELNEANMKEDKYFKTYNWLGKRMYEIGKRQTLRLIDQGKYHSDIEFKSKLPKYTTARNSGLPPIDVTIKMPENKPGYKKDNNKPSMYQKRKDGAIRKAKFASKSAFLMLRGRDALDLNNVSKSNTNLLRDIRNGSVKPTDNVRFTNEEINTICRTYGVSNIGSRSTTAFRDVRAIFNNATTAHFAQAALIYPHIEETTFRPVEEPEGIFISRDYGSVIATRYMDGTTDLVAPAVMSSASGDNVAVLSDCSQWDQTFNSADSIEFYRGVQSALHDRFNLFEDRSYMYEGPKGVNLYDLASWFNEYHGFRWFKAEYAGELKIYKTNFMWSGRLDTFFLNCVQNECYNKKIDEEIVNKLQVKGFKFLTIAGDDVAGVIDAQTWNSYMTDSLKDIVVDTYTDGGKVINRIKSAVVARGGEYAKIYWYYGMVFRDPSIQMFESEKTQRTSTRIEYLRGYSQKVFEYQRRAKTGMRQGSLFARAVLAVTYYLDTQVYDKGMRIKMRYVPPVQAVFIPTFIEGGLGYTLTGTTLNESIFIRAHLDSYVTPATNTLKRLKAVITSDVANIILNLYLSEEQRKALKVDKVDVRKAEVEYKSNDPEIVGVDFARGLKYRVSELDESRIKVSMDATARLKTEGNIKIDKKMIYGFSGYTNFYDSISSMIIDRSAMERAIEKNVANLIQYDNGRVKFIDDLKPVTFSSMLKMYRPFTFTIQKMDNKRVKKQHSYRYVSVPDEGIALETMFGSRHGKASLNSLKGFQLKIRKFIKDTQLGLTEVEVIRTIVDSGALNSTNKITALSNVLAAISGMPDQSHVLASDLSHNDMSWSEEIASINIVGTVLENIQLNDDLVNKLVSVGNINGIPKQFMRMIKYSAFTFLMQEMVYTHDMNIIVNVGTTMQITDLIKHIRPFRMNFDDKEQDTFENVMVHCNLSSIFGDGFIDDMSL